MRCMLILVLWLCGVSAASAVTYRGTFECDDGEHAIVFDFRVVPRPGPGSRVDIAAITYADPDNANVASAAYSGGGLISPRDEMTISLRARGHAPAGFETLSFDARLRGDKKALLGTMTFPGCSGELRASRLFPGGMYSGTLTCDDGQNRGLMILTSRRSPEDYVFYVATYATTQSPALATSAYLVTARPRPTASWQWHTRSIRGVWLGTPGVRRDGFWIVFYASRSAKGFMKVGPCSRFQLQTYRPGR